MVVALIVAVVLIFIGSLGLKIWHLSTVWTVFALVAIEILTIVSLYYLPSNFLITEMTNKFLQYFSLCSGKSK